MAPVYYTCIRKKFKHLPIKNVNTDFIFYSDCFLHHLKSLLAEKVKRELAQILRIVFCWYINAQGLGVIKGSSLDISLNWYQNFDEEICEGQNL